MCRRLAAVLLVAMLAGSCAPDGSPATEDLPAPTTTLAPALEDRQSSTTPAPTTTVVPPTTARAKTTAGDGHEATVPDGDAAPAGIGDSLFPALGNPGYDTEHYLIDLSFDPASAELGGTVTIDATATARLDTFGLDFAGFEIDSVLVDGAQVDFERRGSKLVVIPPTAVPLAEAFTVAVSYRGTPAPARGGAIGLDLGWNTVGETSFVVAEPDAAHTWFPNNDHPSDKATYTFRITVPDGTIAVANGVAAAPITDLGQTTFVYEMDDPMATYLATVVMGDFGCSTMRPVRQPPGYPSATSCRAKP